MRMTQWTDYTLRVLMYCAACQEREKPVTITEIADSHGISRSHLTKIVHSLGMHGLLETTRGRGGGMRLVANARDINLGQVVRQSEPDFAMVECFETSATPCRLDTNCKLKGVLHEATRQFLAVLDGVTLHDLVTQSPTTVQMPTTRKARLPLGIPDTP